MDQREVTHSLLFLQTTSNNIERKEMLNKAVNNLLREHVKIPPLAQSSRWLDSEAESDSDDQSIRSDTLLGDVKEVSSVLAGLTNFVE